MKALDARSIYDVSLPPVPVSAKNGYPMFWHPEDEAFWILVVVEGQAREVWRVTHDGAGTRIFGEADLGFPKDFNNRYVTACLFYFDTVRQSPVWLTMDHANQLLIGVLIGKSFSLIEQANTIVPSTDDSFVFDPNRGVLVHFVGPSHRSSELEGERKARGGFTVRELGGDGVWREVGKPLPEFARYFATCAGWDERQKLAVAIALSDRRVVGWDGKDWHPLASLPEDPWQPSVLGIAPRTKGLTYLQKQRADRVYTALFWELTDRGWNKIDVGTLEEFGGMAYDPIHDEAVLYGGWFGAGTVQHTLARYDGTALVLAGRPSPTISGGSSAGPPCFWGAREPGHGDYSSARSAYTARPVFSVKNGNYEAEPAAPPGIAVCADARARYAVGFEGEVHRFEAGGWKKISGTPKGFARRSDANVGLDGEGRILLVGGDPGGKFLAETWLFDGKAWTKLATKGPTPTVVNAGVAFDSARRAWIVVGGRAKNYTRGSKTSEWDGKKWTASETKFSTDDYSVVDFVAHDDSSGCVFLCRNSEFLCVYRGEGRWEDVASFEPSHEASAFAYDSTRRVLVAAGPSKITEIAIGEVLDLAKSPAPRVTSPKKETVLAKASPKIAPAVWLRLQEGDSDKFWFASLEGSSWTARSGSRGGGAPSEKTHTLATKEAAKAAYEKAVNEKLREGYEHAPERESAAILRGRTSYRIKLGKTGEDTFGGIPKGVTAKSWPLCAECKNPMVHIMMLHAHPQRMPLERYEVLALFVCRNEEGACSTFDPDTGCSATLFLTKAQLERSPLEKPPTSEDGAASAKALRARRISYREVFETDPENEDNAEDIESTSKVGGYPGWIQFAQDLECDTCKKEMVFVAEIGELDEALNFAGGDGYLFRCPDEHQAKFLWQH